ncbi:MAG: hypothetical protein HYR91_04040 [Flavobacteriia bacterium]|nr:hypothetical protein [Flavobacteriia bacterium]
MTNCGEVLGNKDLQVQFKMKKRPAFKAGAELSSTVNLVSVEVNDESIADSEVFELNLKIQKETTIPVDLSIEAIRKMQKELEGKLKCLSQLAECTSNQETQA